MDKEAFLKELKKLLVKYNLVLCEASCFYDPVFREVAKEKAQKSIYSLREFEDENSFVLLKDEV